MLSLIKITYAISNLMGSSENEWGHEWGQSQWGQSTWINMNVIWIALTPSI